MKKPISKLNEKLYSILSKGEEIFNVEASSIYNTRDKHIVANIKVYEWIGESDVSNYIETLPNLSKEDRESILEEFNDNRLNDIYYHTCDDQVSYIKDFIGGCAHTDYNKLKRSFAVYKSGLTNDTLRSCIENNSKTFDKFNTIEQYVKHLETTEGDEYKEFYYLQNLDVDNVWQYGRSGGWLSVAKVSDIEGFCEDTRNVYENLYDAYVSDDNKTFNEVLMEYAYYNETLNDVRKRLIANAENDIEVYNRYKEAIDWILDYIENGRRAFKENLLYQLSFEIDSFIENEFSIDIQIEKFIAGNKEVLNFIKEVENDGTVVTNFNAKVRVKDALQFIEAIKNGVDVINQRIGAFTINKVMKVSELTFVKIGCHVFNLEDTEQRLLQYK